MRHITSTSNSLISFQGKKALKKVCENSSSGAKAQNMSLYSLLYSVIIGSILSILPYYMLQYEITKPISLLWAMAATINFSGQAPWQNMCFRAKAGLTLDSLPFKRSCPLKQNKMKIQHHGIHLSRQAKNVVKKQRQYLVMSSSNNSSHPLSASDMIKQFYTYLNDKKLFKLDDYISANCHFEECSFPNVLQGRQEVMNFFTQLAEGMGQNVKFKIEHVCEGDDHTAAVVWHLEWKKEQIPFTRGCSFFECAKEDDSLMIKKARIVIESPIKPGGIVLTLLKNVTALFDEFPKATEWLLKSPHVVVNYLLKIYSIFFAPFINPLLSGYINMWNAMARVFGYILTFVFYIAKSFLK